MLLLDQQKKYFIYIYIQINILIILHYFQNGEQTSANVETIPSSDIKSLLKGLPERKRRSILR